MKFEQLKELAECADGVQDVKEMAPGIAGVAIDLAPFTAALNAMPDQVQPLQMVGFLTKLMNNYFTDKSGDIDPIAGAVLLQAATCLRAQNQMMNTSDQERAQ